MWYPSSTNRFSTRTPRASKIFTNSFSLSTKGSPPYPLMKHAGSCPIFSPCAASAAVGLQYSWSRSAPSGSERDHMRSVTDNGKTRSLTRRSSESERWEPPKKGAFINMPRILRGERSWSSARSAAK